MYTVDRDLRARQSIQVRVAREAAERPGKDTQGRRGFSENIQNHPGDFLR
jgi:hypothetical protein